jgi:hypothetical protein
MGLFWLAYPGLADHVVNGHLDRVLQHSRVSPSAGFSSPAAAVGRGIALPGQPGETAAEGLGILGWPLAAEKLEGSYRLCLLCKQQPYARALGSILR